MPQPTLISVEWGRITLSGATEAIRQLAIELRRQDVAFDEPHDLAGGNTVVRSQRTRFELHEVLSIVSDIRKRGHLAQLSPGIGDNPRMGRPRRGLAFKVQRTIAVFDHSTETATGEIVALAELSGWEVVCDPVTTRASKKRCQTILMVEFAPDTPEDSLWAGPTDTVMGIHHKVPVGAARQEAAA